MSKVAYKGFKVNDNNQLQCKDMIYELDKEYVVDGNLKLCENGMHFCWDIKDVHWYYALQYSAICEVEILGDVLEDDDDKACTNKLKILRIMDKDELMELTNVGTGNIGYFNIGNNNIGDRNEGNRNKGNRNIGDDNEGVDNNGNGNIGDNNNGNRNKCHWNKGDDNNGYYNIGNSNIGNRNKGNDNIGNRNKGDKNNGSYNTGDNIIGFFNTISDIGSLDNIALFNKLSNISMEEFKQMDVYTAICDICYWGWSSKYNGILIQSPNFDKDIFEEILGVERLMFEIKIS